jgi:hypothetical protein
MSSALDLYTTPPTNVVGGSYDISSKTIIDFIVL